MKQAFGKQSFQTPVLYCRYNDGQETCEYMDIHFGRDWKLFCRAGLSEAYESAGNYNLFIVCSKQNPGAYRELPEGYSFRLCTPGELGVWTRTVAEDQYADYVAEYDPVQLNTQSPYTVTTRPAYSPAAWTAAVSPCPCVTVSRWTGADGTFAAA